jgi:Phasin protein
MPKRRSLAGTGREAIGDAGGTRPDAASAAAEPPAKQPGAAPKAKAAAARKPAPSARPPIEPTPERQSAAAASPATAYEAMMGFASATFRQNLETGAKLARCKSPMEALAAQTAHAAALTQTFIAVSLRLMQLSFSTASWASIRQFDRRAEPQ